MKAVPSFCRWNIVSLAVRPSTTSTSRPSAPHVTHREWRHASTVHLLPGRTASGLDRVHPSIALSPAPAFLGTPEYDSMRYTRGRLAVPEIFCAPSAHPPQDHGGMNLPSSPNRSDWRATQPCLGSELKPVYSIRTAAASPPGICHCSSCLASIPPKRLQQWIARPHLEQLVRLPLAATCSCTFSGMRFPC